MGRSPVYKSPSTLKRNIRRQIIFSLKKTINELELKLINQQSENTFNLSKIKDKERSLIMNRCQTSGISQIAIDPVKPTLSCSVPVKTTYPRICESCSCYQCYCVTSIEHLSCEMRTSKKKKCLVTSTFNVSIEPRSNLSISNVINTIYPEPCLTCLTFPCKCVTIANIEELLNQNTKRFKEELSKSLKSYDKT